MLRNQYKKTDTPSARNKVNYIGIINQNKLYLKGKVVHVHAMQAYRGSRVIAPPIRKISTRL
jgi:hypothetical protein